jgi:hypothetical protein
MADARELPVEEPRAPVGCGVDIARVRIAVEDRAGSRSRDGSAAAELSGEGDRLDISG